MIADQQARDSIQQAWSTVRILEARINTTLCNGNIFSLLPAATNFREVPDSLLLLFATSTLEEALKQLRDESVISCVRSELSSLMRASRNVLPWQDYATVDRARDRRNAIAHSRTFLGDGECALYLNAIEAELVAWKVLDHRIRGEFSISIGGPGPRPNTSPPPTQE